MNVYANTIFATTPAHGVFSVTKAKDGLKKMPIGKHGCASFDAPASEIKTSQTRLLGRAFGAGDGVIGFDLDGWIPDAYWSGGTGYFEISASGTGAHIIARVPQDIIPNTGNKIVVTRDKHKIELFYGRNVGIAITGKTATYTVPDLDMESPAGQILQEAFFAKYKNTDTPHQTDKNAPLIAAPLTGDVLGDIIADVQRWAVLSNKTIPPTASEAFQSACNRIAGDLGQKEAYEGREGLLTTENIRKIWELTEIYQHYYAGKSKYAPHKIEPTLKKALIYGQKRKKEAQKLPKWAAKTKKEEPPEPEPEPPKHPEGFCISDDGTPEFWCDEYDHPLRYHMAHIARYAQTAMQQPNAITAWICAVFFGTIVCARQYAAELIPYGVGDGALIFPRLYAIVSGKSGAGKDDITRGLNELVSAIAAGGKNQKVWGLICPNSNWTSDAAVHAAIALHPQSVAIWDECGRKIQRAQNDAIANSMLMKLTEAFSRAHDVLRAPQYANPKDQQLPKGINVWHPAMSIIGMGTPRQMEAITEDTVESGQFARFLYYTIPLRITKPVERVKFNPQTHFIITEILRTATFSPEIRPTKRQELLKVLRWDPDAPVSACDVRDSVRKLAIAAKSDADVAILNRVFEIGVILAISRTILGTRHGTEAEYVSYDTMKECIAEAKKSMWHFHEIVVDAPVFSPREVRIADAIEQIFRDKLKSPFRAYYGTEIAPELKKMHITVGGFKGERQNIDAILTGRGIAAGREGNTPTGRKYYYDSSSPTAQAEQDEYDLQLRNAAKTAAREGAN